MLFIVIHPNEFVWSKIIHFGIKTLYDHSQKSEKQIIPRKFFSNFIVLFSVVNFEMVENYLSLLGFFWLPKITPIHNSQKLPTTGTAVNHENVFEWKALTAAKSASQT